MIIKLQSMNRFVAEFQPAKIIEAQGYGYELKSVVLMKHADLDGGTIHAFKYKAKRKGSDATLYRFIEPQHIGWNGDVEGYEEDCHGNGLFWYHDSCVKVVEEEKI